MRKCEIGFIVLMPFLLYTKVVLQSELYTKVTESILPGSYEVHEKLGIKGAVEKEYAVITLIKREPEEVVFNTISFQWQGPPIEHLSATFFKKTGNYKPVVPLEENVIGEGKWNSKQQILTFVFKGIKLQGTNTFSLVFLVTSELEKLLPKGTFSIIASSLPETFQQRLHTKYLALA